MVNGSTSSKKCFDKKPIAHHCLLIPIVLSVCTRVGCYYSRLTASWAQQVRTQTYRVINPLCPNINKFCVYYLY